MGDYSVNQMMMTVNKYLAIDEAQRINDIGLKLKLITDQIPELQVIQPAQSDGDGARIRTFLKSLYESVV